MSPSELLKRRHSPHQRITEREEDDEEDSGSGDDSGNGSDSDDGDDGKGNDEDQSTTEGEDDNEEQTVTEERTITQQHTVTASPTASGVQKLHHSLPPAFGAFPGSESHLDPASWSWFIQLHTAGKRSSSTEIISTPNAHHEDTPESTSVSSQEHTTTTDPLKMVTASPMAHDGKKARSGYDSLLSPWGLQNLTSLVGKRSTSSIPGFISLEDACDQATPDSTTDASNDDSTASTMMYVCPFP